MSYDPREQEIILGIFYRMLAAVTRDGGEKRARAEKIPWWRDPGHEAAIFSHLTRWKRGELRDPDSGAHPLVHLAWRALALAWIETHGTRPPAESAVDQESGREYHEQGRPAPRAGVITMTSDTVCCRLDCENFGKLLADCPKVKIEVEDPGASDPCGRPDCEEVRVAGLHHPLEREETRIVVGTRAGGGVEESARRLDLVRGGRR